MKPFARNALARTLAVAAVWLVVAIPGPAFSQSPAERKSMQDAEALIKQGRPADAYALLAPLEDALAGNIDFDYLLGISALDSGRADKATLAFERVIAANPNFAGARLDMARAYFQLGDLPRARSEFNTVLEQKPPEDARQVVLKHLAAIEAAEKAQQRSLRAYMEYTFGIDSNINSSTSQSIVNVPALGNIAFTLDPTSRGTRSRYHAFAVGAEYSEKITPEFAFFVGGDFRMRENKANATFDNDNYDYRAGLLLGSGDHLLRLSANYGRYYVNDPLNRFAEGAGADYRYTINANNQLNVFTQYTRTRFTGEASRANSFDSLTSGFGGLHIIGQGNAAVFGAFFWGEEIDTDRRADGSKRFHGFRLGGQLKLRDDLDAFAMHSQQFGWYGRENAAFQARRQDDLFDITTGLNWRFAKSWTLRPQFVYQFNHSNIPINAFRRNDLSLTLRYDFL